MAKSPEEKRLYMRDWMRKRRAGLPTRSPPTVPARRRDPRPPTGLKPPKPPRVALVPDESPEAIAAEIRDLVEYKMRVSGLDCMSDPSDPEAPLVQAAIDAVQAEMDAEAEASAAAEIAAKVARQMVHDGERDQRRAAKREKELQERADKKAAQAQASTVRQAARLSVHRAAVAERRRLRRITKAAARTAAREAENESKSLQPPDLASFPGETGPMDRSPAGLTTDRPRAFVDEPRTSLVLADGTDPNMRFRKQPLT